MIRKAEELEEKQRLHQTELTKKEKNILDQAQVIEEKIQKYEEAQVALTETEIKRVEAETKLTAAEETILDLHGRLRELQERKAWPTAGFCNTFCGCFRKPAIDVAHNNDDKTHSS